MPRKRGEGYLIRELEDLTLRTELERCGASIGLEIGRDAGSARDLGAELL